MFSGDTVEWNGESFAMIGRMLRGWLPMLKMEVQEKLERVIKLVEVEAGSAPMIMWMDSLASVQSNVPVLEDSASVIIIPCNRA